MFPLNRALLSLAVASCLLAPRFARADSVEGCVASAEKGQSARRENQLLEAREQFISCARDACPKMIRADCARWFDDVEARIPAASVRVRTEDGRDLPAKLEIDGKAASSYEPGRAMPMDPGKHTFRAEAEGFEPASEDIVLAEGEKARVVTLVVRSKEKKEAAGDAPKEEERAGPPVLVYPLAGLGAAALGSFAFFGLSGHADAEDLRGGCGRTASCAESDVDAARTKYIVADVSLGVGIVALGAAAVLWLTSR